MLIFGGEATDGNLQNTMWRFDLGEQCEILIMKFDINIDPLKYNYHHHVWRQII